MKLNLSKNKKFLLSLLVLAITYCSNVNATVCKWDGCTPMYKNWYGVYHRFNRSHAVGFFNKLNDYSNQNIDEIKKECDLWEGQWPLNCPMRLTNQNNAIIWTDEFLKEIEEYRKNKKYEPLICTVPFYSALATRGLFNEVLEFQTVRRSAFKNDCNNVYKLYPFGPNFMVMHTLNNYPNNVLNLSVRFANDPNSNVESYKFEYLQQKDVEILFDFIFFQSFKNFIEQALEFDQNNWWKGAQLNESDFAPLNRSPFLFDTIFNHALNRARNYLSSNLTLDLNEYQAKLKQESSSILSGNDPKKFDPHRIHSRAEEFKKLKESLNQKFGQTAGANIIELTETLFKADYLAKVRDAQRAVQSDLAKKNQELVQELL